MCVSVRVCACVCAWVCVRVYVYVCVHVTVFCLCVRVAVSFCLCLWNYIMLPSPKYALCVQFLPVGGAPVAGLLADFGVNSIHFDSGPRGFSFRHDGPLDMRFDPVCVSV